MTRAFFWRTKYEWTKSYVEYRYMADEVLDVLLAYQAPRDLTLGFAKAVQAASAYEYARPDSIRRVHCGHRSD